MATINGKEIAEEILQRLKKQSKPEKFLAVVLVGDNPASLSFIGQKERVARELAVDFRLYQLSPELSQDELRKKVLETVEHKTCGGAIVQLPLPTGINRHYVMNVIPRDKDVDVLGERALGAFYAGRNTVFPPVVAVVEEILKRLGKPVEKLRTVVIGAGFLIGKPIATYLSDKAAEVAVFQRNSNNFLERLKDFDLVICGAGHAGMIKASDIKPGAVVIDFGYDAVEGKGVGDFDLAGAEASGIIYTPTPGGAGPILIAKLFENFYKLNML